MHPSGAGDILPAESCVERSSEDKAFSDVASLEDKPTTEALGSTLGAKPDNFSSEQNVGSSTRTTTAALESLRKKPRHGSVESSDSHMCMPIQKPVESVASELPKECPVIIELFAGSGRVTAHLKHIGIKSAFGVDHKVLSKIAPIKVCDLTTTACRCLHCSTVRNMQSCQDHHNSRF